MNEKEALAKLEEECKKINFHIRDVNSKEYIENQRKFAKARYIYDKFGNDEYGKVIDLYFYYLDKYPEYALECEKHAKKMMQQTGYKKPPSLDSYPDHTYASRMSGISADYVRMELFRGYYYRSDASMPTQEEIERKNRDDTLDWLF